MVPGKLGLVETKVNVLVGRPFELGFFALSLTADFPLPIASMCEGTLTLIVEVKRLRP